MALNKQRAQPLFTAGVFVNVLADRTYGRAYGTVLRPSVCRL